MPGLTLIGPIAGAVRVPSPNEVQAGAEECGMFVLGDARDVPLYSGMDLGGYWLCRAMGPATELLRDWPTEGGRTWGYDDQGAAIARYDAIRAHLFARFQGVQAYDARDQLPLNAADGRAEVFVQNGTEVCRMFVDHMADLQIANRNTDCVRTFDGHPRAPGRSLVSYSTQSDVLYLAIGKGASGAAEHVCIVYSPEHKPEPVISEGMPRAEKQKTQRSIQITSGFVVAMWGVTSGARVMAPAQGQDPAGMLHAYMAENVAVPLSTNDPAGMDQRAAAPCAWAVRVDPGEYEVGYYELDARAGAGYSMVCLSKKGAASFQPYVPGNAGGRTIGGMTLEQYAEVSFQRDQILMTQGANAGPALEQLCRRYGMEVPTGPMGGVNTGYAGRIVEWDQVIHSDPKLTGEFLAQKQIAGMRAAGMQPTPEQLAAIRAQSDANAAMLKQNADANTAARNELFEGAKKLVDAARGKNEQQIIDEAKKLFPTLTQKDGTPAYGIRRAIEMLKNPGEDGNPRFAGVDQVTEKLARAHYRSMTPEDQKFEGSEKGYVKDVIESVYEKNGLPVPGVGGFLGRLMDKLLPPT